MRFLIKYVVVFLSIITLSCNNSKNNNSMLPTVEQSNSMKKESNAITQSMPSIMVVPSDALLKRMGCLKEE